MHMILLFLGVLCVAAGIAPVLWGFDYPFDERNALMLRGTIAIIGGLALIALGSMISHLRRIHEAIETLRLAPASGATQAATTPDLAQAVVAEPPRKPVAEIFPRPEAVEVPEGASMPSPEVAPKAPAHASPATEWPRVDAGDRFAAAGAIGGRGGTPAAAEAVRPSGAEEPPKTDAEQPAPAPKPTILKSGVIEGIPYTAYSDGSFEAEFTEGTQRFTSFKELRMHFASRGIA
jgi:hypothetical protein